MNTISKRQLVLLACMAVSAGCIIAAFWGVLPAPVLVETFISGVVLKSLWETIVYALATRHIITAVKAMPDE